MRKYPRGDPASNVKKGAAAMTHASTPLSMRGDDRQGLHAAEFWGDSHLSAAGRDSFDHVKFEDVVFEDTYTPTL